MRNAGLLFRTTNDLDIVILVEALSTEFIIAFWILLIRVVIRISIKSKAKRNTIVLKTQTTTVTQYVWNSFPGFRNSSPLKEMDAIVLLQKVLRCLLYQHFSWMMNTTVSSKMLGLTLMGFPVSVPIALLC